MKMGVIFDPGGKAVPIPKNYSFPKLIYETVVVSPLF